MSTIKDFCAEITRNTEQIIEQNGYHWEKHYVTTEDGYINTMYRIPYGKNRTSEKKRPPVMLSHGLICSSSGFVNQCCLGYYLADEGFDVWLPNNRGTTFSRKHAHFDAEEEKAKYWNFTLHEIGVYDTTAFVDHILKETGFKKVSYIGHSQGTIVFAIFLSERPEYNDKIAVSCQLAPSIIYKNKIPFLLKYLTHFFVPAIELAQKYLHLEIYEVPFVHSLRSMGTSKKLNKFTNVVSQISLGYPDYEQSTEIDYSQFCLTNPNSASIRQVYHYCQIVRSGRFGQYDYGKAENTEIYGSEKPPLYELSKITSPVFLFYGKNDMYTNIEDNLENLMGNVVKKITVDFDAFNHFDFLTAKDNIQLVYSPISKILKSYKYPTV